MDATGIFIKGLIGEGIQGIADGRPGHFNTRESPCRCSPHLITHIIFTLVFIEHIQISVILYSGVVSTTMAGLLTIGKEISCSRPYNGPYMINEILLAPISGLGIWYP